MTFYTLAKVNVLCGPNDHRIGVSKGWSYVNIIISSIAYSFPFDINDNGGYDYNHSSSHLIMGVPLFSVGAILTIIFLHYDSLFCCCCDCCLGEEQVVIHDPSNPEANLVWKDGKVQRRLFLKVS